MSITGASEKLLSLDTSISFAERAKDLVSGFRIEEKAGLMNHPASARSGGTMKPGIDSGSCKCHRRVRVEIRMLDQLTLEVFLGVH